MTFFLHLFKTRNSILPGIVHTNLYLPSYFGWSSPIGSLFFFPKGQSRARGCHLPLCIAWIPTPPPLLRDAPFDHRLSTYCTPHLCYFSTASSLSPLQCIIWPPSSVHLLHTSSWLLYHSLSAILPPPSLSLKKKTHQSMVPQYMPM